MTHSFPFPGRSGTLTKPLVNAPWRVLTAMTSLRRVLITVVLGLAIATTGAALEATALAKTHAAHHKKAAKHRAKKRSSRSKTTARGEKGPKGDKGDAGAKGDKGDKGDPGSSIVARARLASPTSTGDGDNGAEMPLTGNAWTAVPDEADDFAGSVTATAPSACDAPSSGFDPLAPVLGSEDSTPYVAVVVQLDGDEFFGDGFRDWTDGDAGKTLTFPLNFHSRTVAGDNPTPHTLKVEGFDGCGGQGQSFTITDVRINVYGMH
jgi:hypothetical protein